MNFHGTFKKIRELRDYSYHVNYTKERQSWQDQAFPSGCGPHGTGKVRGEAVFCHVLPVFDSS